MKHISHPAAVIVLVAFLPLHGIAGEPKPEDKARIWEKYANHAYSSLNARLNGSLTPVFRALGNFGDLHEYFDKNSNPEKYEAYCQFLVQAFADAKDGDVGEAMFANVLLASTPPKVVLAAVAPHIGKGGRLEGILEGKHSDVAKHIQRQPQQGHIGPPSFIEYVRYLKGGKDRDFTKNVNAAVIVDHMLRTDPQEAFISMLWADYGFNPYKRGNCYLFCRNDTRAVRDLQLAYSDIADYLSRIRYSFPVRERQTADVATHLRRLTDHKKWWVRLYVACLITTEPQLREPELIRKLSNDHNEHVRAAIEYLAEEQSQGR